jgi:hypothetical protein
MTTETGAASLLGVILDATARALRTEAGATDGVDPLVWSGATGLG